MIRKRGKYYHFEIWLDGERRAFGAFNGKDGLPLARDKREAMDFEGQIRQEVIAGTYRRGEDREGLKYLAAFVDKVYLPFAREHHASPAHDEFRCAMLKAHFAGRRLDQITTMLVERFINDRLGTDTVRIEKFPDGRKVAKPCAPTTVHKEVVLLSSIFNMAKQERLVAENPCDFVRKSVRKKIPARVTRNRYLTLEEEGRLFDKLTGRREHITTAVRLAPLTGDAPGRATRPALGARQPREHPAHFRHRGRDLGGAARLVPHRAQQERPAPRPAAQRQGSGDAPPAFR